MLGVLGRKAAYCIGITNEIVGVDRTFGKAQPVFASFGVSNECNPFHRTTAMITDISQHPHQPPDKATVVVNDRPYVVADATPTGRQILAAAGLRPETAYALIAWPANGPTREIGLDEVLRLRHSDEPAMFFAAESDGVSYFMLDDERFAWAGPLTLEIIRRIGRIGPEREVWIELRDLPDQPFPQDVPVDLAAPGLERFYTKPARRTWFLDIQGERTKWDKQFVPVWEAMEAAGADLTKEYTILFKFVGGKRETVDLTDTLDLGLEGIERLWYRPRKVNNGEAVGAMRRAFSLLDQDVEFLDRTGWGWQTLDEGRRWLVVESYPLPAGYTTNVCRIAVEVSAQYPTAEIDMFYCYPPLALSSGMPLAACDHIETIDGLQYQRWSRHRDSSAPWVPGKDNVRTHFGLVEESLGREVGA